MTKSWVGIWVRCPENHKIGIAPNATTPSIWRVIQNPCGVGFRLCSFLELCQKPFWKNMSVEENFVRWKKLKSRKIESTVICPLRFFFLWSDRVQGAFFTKITFPKGFWITRKTDGGVGRDSEHFGCVIPVSRHKLFLVEDTCEVSWRNSQLAGTDEFYSKNLSALDVQPRDRPRPRYR